jgi:hypothetical protein
MSQHSPPESYTYLKCTLSSNRMHDNPSLHARLTCKSYKISSLVYSGISVVMDTQSDDVPISYIFHSIPLLVMDLVLQSPNTAQMLGIHPYGGLQSYTWYTRLVPASPSLL